MRHCLLALLALLALAFNQAVAQNKSEKPSLDGAKIFIEPMQGDLLPFIEAEIVKKKLPVVIVMERKNADYILAGSFIKGEDKSNRTGSGATNKNQGSVQLLNMKDKTVVWAGEADDRSMFLGGWSRGGQSKVADRIINRMKNDLFAKLKNDTSQRTDADHIQRESPPNSGEQVARDGADHTVVDPASVRRKYEAAVQNALGFKQGVYSATEFPGVQGIFINNLISDDSPAALANIQAGDLLTELNNKQVRNDSELSQVLESLATGQEVQVKLYRDGAMTSSRIKIADRALPPSQPKADPRDQGFLGILDSFRSPLPDKKKWGVQVKALHNNGPAKLCGLRPGDLITEFNGHPVKTSSEFNRQIRAVRPGSKVMVTFYRGGAEQKIEVTMGNRSEALSKRSK
ncbi:MAG: PDZ domain-containing protein [Chloracidobacterium sp.]|nr:PDZ domain-containing protein [Chloracidobacterium sp.]